MQDPRVGTTVAGRYVLESVIGEGGMATVYGAHHRLVDRHCAVKVMSRAYARNEVVRERFRREARAAQKLAHPNIIEIFDQGETPDGCLFLVMELLEGESLAEALAFGKLGLERALPIAVQMARALARAHDLEVIHRDLKPENIFLARLDVEERVKLLDFGIARSMQDLRLTGAGEVFGTPQYMAPERLTSIDCGPPADLYAFGAILYEMLTGDLPFDAEDVPGFFMQHLKEPAPSPRQKDPSIPEIIARLVLEMLEKKPEERPVDAHRVLADLVSISGSLGIRVPREPAAEPDSYRAPAPTLPPVAIDRWAHRTAVFDQMLRCAYPATPPRELVQLLSEVRRLIAEIGELRQRAVQEQRSLQAIETRARETRQRFGTAVQALGVDLSRSRDELKAALAAHVVLSAQDEDERKTVARTHRDVLTWEGRSGFQRPYPELAAAYRAAASAVDRWTGVHRELERTERRAQEHRRAVSDLEYQVDELRAALAQSEEKVQEEARSREQAVGDYGRRADELESKLIDLATRFCEPLRSRPELSVFFRELETEVAA
jgi:serine/threonine-protein kinase